MVIGASTANLYPERTEEALERLLELGFRELEVFLNTESELSGDYIRAMREQAEAAGARIRAVHPYSSFMEPYLLFSVYKRRTEDGLRFYERLFATVAALGADYLVLHGDRLDSSLPPEEFAERYARLYESGRRQGITLLQENVARFRSRTPDFVREMRRLLGEQAQFVLDVKQCARSGVAVADMLDAMEGAIRHVHISDHDAAHDCLLPGRGTVDYPALFTALAAGGFDGSMMLELYRENYGRPEELLEGKRHLESISTSLWPV